MPERANRIADVESAEIARLERVRRVMPWLAAHDTVEAWLRDNPDAPVLDAALAPRLAEARSAIVMAEQRVLRERETAAHLVEQIGQIVVDDVLLREVAEIERLAEATGAARKAMIDLPAVTARALALAELMAARLRELGSPLPVERAGDAIHRAQQSLVPVASFKHTPLGRRRYRSPQAGSQSWSGNATLSSHSYSNH